MKKTIGILIFIIVVFTGLSAFAETPTGILKEVIMSSTVAITTEIGMGAGIIVTRDGYIITNKHVVIGWGDTPATMITVYLHDFTEYRAHIVGIHSTADIAVIKINPLDDLSFVDEKNLVNPHQLMVGDEVYAIGHPLGLAWSISRGVLSSIRKDNEDQTWYQIDAPINPGNSGGPVVNDTGKLIGIATMGVPAFAGENLAFAIAVRTFREEVYLIISEDIIRNEIIKDIWKYQENRTQYKYGQYYR